MIDNFPKFTVWPTGALNCEMRAVILSSPCICAKGSEIISAAWALHTAPAAASAIPASAPPNLTPRTSRFVGIDEPGDDAGQNVAHLALVAAHQHGVLERVLRQTTQLGKVLVEHLDLLDAGDRFAFRRAPGRKLVRCLIGHDLSHSQGSWVLRYMSRAGADLPSYRLGGAAGAAGCAFGWPD